MKKLKEIFHRVAQSIPGVRDPETLEEAQGNIVKDASYIGTMRRWANNVGVATLAVIGIGVFAKSGFILAPALALAGVYGAIQLGVQVIKRNMRENRKAEAAFIEAANAPEELSPAPTPGVDVGAAFKAKAEPVNDNAERIKALEQQLATLEMQAEQKRKQKELGL